MRWIKYQVVCGKNETGDNVLLTKRIGYSTENLAIAKVEAYNGYIIEDDGKSYEKEPIGIEFGGTGANNAADACRNIGAAPAGFGLGVQILDELTNEAQLHYATKNGWYYVNGFSKEYEGLIDFVVEGYPEGLLKVNSAQSITEQIFLPSLPKGEDCRLRRFRLGDKGEFGGWEYENPPMKPGFEYRTTERYKGKPVYRKLVAYATTSSVGNSVSCSDVNVSHGIHKFDELVRCSAVVNRDTPLPFMSSTGGITMVCGCDTSKIKLRILNDIWDSPAFYFDIAYTKA